MGIAEFFIRRAFARPVGSIRPTQALYSLAQAKAKEGRVTMKITGIWNKPGDDGGFTVEVTMPDGSTTTASMEAGVGRALVAIIQPTMVEEAVDRAQSMAMAGVQVNGLSIVQKGQIPELMVVTAELGQLVLEMVDEWILEMRRMIGLIV